MTVTTGIDPARTGSGRSSSDHRSARSARRPSGRSTAGGLYGAGSYRRPSAGRGRRGRINGNEWAKRRYDLSVLQAEFSLTQMLDRPVSGQVFFEEVIRENRRLLDVERFTHDPTIGADAFDAVVTPAVVGTQRGSALPFGTTRTRAQLAVLVVFRGPSRGLVCVLDGFNRSATPR